MELTIRHIIADYPYNLLLQADETREGIDKYLFDSDVYLAQLPGMEEPVGVFCLLRIDDATVEIMNIAVDEPWRGRGAGGAMIEHAALVAAEKGYREIIVGTADCAAAQIRFYERHGFRRSGIRKNYYTDIYSEPIYEDGVQLRDMVVLARQIPPVRPIES